MRRFLVRMVDAGSDRAVRRTVLADNWSRNALVMDQQHGVARGSGMVEFFREGEPAPCFAVPYENVTYICDDGPTDRGVVREASGS